MSRIAGAVAPVEPPTKSPQSGRHLWAPGQSGNPSGRPRKSQEVVEQAKRLAPKAIRKIGKLMMDKRASPAVQLAAAVHIIDRALGKPASFSTGSPDAFRKAIDMTDDELAAIVAAGKGRVLELVANKPSKPTETSPVQADTNQPGSLVGRDVGRDGDKPETPA